MDAHKEVIEFLKISRDCSDDDVRIQEIQRLAHIFLIHFCQNNPENQRILHQDLKIFLSNIHNIQDASTMTAIFKGNAELCNSVTLSIVQQFVSCIEKHGRSAEYIDFLKTVVRDRHSCQSGESRNFCDFLELLMLLRNFQIAEISKN